MRSIGTLSVCVFLGSAASCSSGASSGAAAGSGGDAGSIDGGGSPSGGNLPKPSHDCSTDTSDNCIAIAGAYNGKAIDVFCDAADGTSVLVHAGKWVVGCDNMNPGFARLRIPIQEPGPFMEVAALDAGAPMEFEFSADTSTSVALFAGNLQDAELAGNVAATGTAAYPYRTVTGTLRGAWATPSSSCLSLSGGTCVATEINVNFRLMSRYGTCLSSTECTSPQTCDSVGYYCN
jgi:hypothetical protein